jgi:hypothetical protein
VEDNDEEDIKIISFLERAKVGGNLIADDDLKKVVPNHPSASGNVDLTAGKPRYPRPLKMPPRIHDHRCTSPVARKNTESEKEQHKISPLTTTSRNDLSAFTPQNTNYGADLDAGLDQPTSVDQSSNGVEKVIEQMPERRVSSETKKGGDDVDLDVCELTRRAMGL